MLVVVAGFVLVVVLICGGGIVYLFVLNALVLPEIPLCSHGLRSHMRCSREERIAFVGSRL